MYIVYLRIYKYTQTDMQFCLWQLSLKNKNQEQQTDLNTTDHLYHDNYNLLAQGSKQMCFC